MTQLKCRTCSSETHSTLLCRSADDAAKAEGKKPVSGGAFTTETEVKGADPAGAVEPAGVAPPETTSNMASTYDHLDSEAYLLNRDGRGSNLTHTCVGQACVIDKNNREVYCGTLFDHCSSDAWISASFAREIGAKRLPDWQGTLRTIKGVEAVKLPAVAIKVFNYETGQYVSLECLVTREIGRKPAIEQPRF